VLIFFCAILAVIPLWVAQFLPFSDMPEQVAAIALLRHWWDPTWLVSKDYFLAFGDSQYFIYHAVGALLTTVVGSAELANRILLTAVGFSYPYALRSLARSLGRDERIALFAPAAFWSAPLLMGFIPFVASVPAAAWAISAVIKRGRGPHTKAAWVQLSLIAIAIFYLHVSAYIFLLACAGLITTLSVFDRDTPPPFPRGIADVFIRLTWILPSALFGVAWAARGSLRSHVNDASVLDQAQYPPWKDTIKQLPVWAHDIWMSHIDEACAVGFWGAFAVILVLSKSPPNPRSSRIAYIPLCVAIALFICLPYSLGTGAMLNTRMAVFVTYFAPLVLLPDQSRVIRAAFAAVVASMLILSIDSAYEIRLTEKDELGDANRLIDKIPARASVLMLPYRWPSTHTHWPAWNYLASYHVARTGGMSSVSFTELAHWPIRKRPGLAPAKRLPFWTVGGPCLFRNSTDGPLFDYVLTRGGGDPLGHVPIGPIWKRIDTERDWSLYARQEGEYAPGGVIDYGPCGMRGM